MDGTSDLFQRCPDKFFFFFLAWALQKLKYKGKSKGSYVHKGGKQISHITANRNIIMMI